MAQCFKQDETSPLELSKNRKEPKRRTPGHPRFKKLDVQETQEKKLLDSGKQMRRCLSGMRWCLALLSSTSISNEVKLGCSIVYGQEGLC